MKKVFHPIRMFIAILIVAIVWLAPIVTKPRQIIRTNPPILVEYNSNNLLLAIPEASASCAPSCKIRVCVDWDPTPCGSNPWDIGCCLAYADECDPGCDVGGGGGNQPPTISHTFNCSDNGNNGWCKGSLSLDLTASDPQTAQVIISGTINGIAFACPTGNTTCSVPLLDGQGAITYRVDSSTGLSDSDTTTYKLDSTTPQINGSIAGTTGLNNWYVSSTTLSATSTDTTSGVSLFEMNIDNTGYVSYAETTFNNGIHTIQYRAIDNAGNVTETAVQEIKVDTVTPVINISTTGTSGLNNWYTSNIILSATSNDITSGISTFEININNTGWANYAETTLTDGIHTIQYRATDNAGNTYTTTSQEIKVDTTTPSLDLNTNGTKGQNNWYISAVSITPIASDSTSGISSIEHSLNNGTFNAYTSPLQFSDGVHVYQIKVTDYAGNITITPSLTIKVDTIAPTVEADSKINLGETLYYTLQDNGSGLWIERIVIEDEDEKYKKIVWLQTINGNKIEGDILWDGKFADKTQAPAGEYYIVFKISDQAGNETFQTTTVTITPLSFLLPITPFTPPTSSDEITSNELTSDEEEQNFGNETNDNVGNETNSISNGGEAVFVNAIAQAGISFASGNENTATPITNSNILWGAVAAAAVGMTLAEWQKRREEEERKRKEEEQQNASQGTSKAAREKYEAKMRMKRIIGESQVLLNEKKKEKEKQNAVSSARWNGIAQVEQAKEKEKQNAVSAARWVGIANIEKEKQKTNTGGSKPLSKLVNDEPLNWWEKLISTFTPTPSVTSTFTPSITPTPSNTPTQTPSPTKTPLPTPTTDNINIALSYLQHSPQGLDLYRELNRKANNVTIEYSTTTYGAMIPIPVTKEYLFGLIKIPTYDVKILVNPQQTPTFIAGTIAHESYHFLTPGSTGLEEYNAYRIGDEVRNDIIQAGYGTNADLFTPLSHYTVNTNNPNLGQLIRDLDNWFINENIPDYASGGSYGMTSLPTMPTSTLTPSSTPTLTPTSTSTQTFTPTATATQTPTPTETPKPNQIGGGK